MQQKIRNYQETVNKRLEQFGILNQRHRYVISNYGDALRPCVVVTQRSLDGDGILFGYGYRDMYNLIGRKNGSSKLAMIASAY